jgi:glutamate-1-semialdehyde 2,1-aminomutase
MSTIAPGLAALDSVRNEYVGRTPRSRAAFDAACEVVPGGISRSGIAFAPHPIVFESGHGCRAIDVDGHEYIDFLNNHASLVHGHAHPDVTAAIRQQAERGTAWSAISEDEARLARSLCERVRSLERVRFTNSGTEAGMQAARMVRAFTGRPLILKFEGGMHGGFDDLEVSKRPALERAGPDDDPRSVAGPGFAAGAAERVIVAPFNNRQAVARRIEKYREELAAVFVEPIMSFAGQILPEDGFLDFLRQITREHRVLLVADEVVTLRLAHGGGQEVFGFQPDLSLFGKIIGGGLPAGAVGGREDVMAVSGYQLHPDQGLRLSLSGTFSGAAIVMTAGAAALSALDREAIGRINRLGDELRRRLQASCDDAGLKAQVTGLGSSLHIHFTARPVRDYRDAASNNWAVTAAMHLWLLTRGIYPSPQGWFNISTAMTEREIDAAVAAFSDGLTFLRPYIEQVAPDLLASSRETRGMQWSLSTER